MPDPISWTYAWPYLLAAFAGGYCLGSIPFGLVLTKITGAGDLRAIGSKSIGATNVLRTGRKDLAIATLLLDGAKGAVAVLIARAWGPDMALTAGFAAILGHMFPVWLLFRGGKGVATAIGTFLAFVPFVGLAVCATWLIVAAIFRISSLSSLISIAASPVFVWFIYADLQRVQWCAAIALLVWIRHASNIVRLIKGEESKIGRSKSSTK